MIMHRADPSAVIRALRGAAPYIRLYKGKTFVVKAGGGVFGDAEATRALVEQIAILHSLGIRVVFVHGGGPQLTEVTEKLGVPTQMIEGRRITDARSIDATAMVLSGLINTRILAVCRELEIPAIGISGVDAGLVQAHKRAPVKLQTGDGMVDYGLVGDIDYIDTDVIRKLLDNGSRATTPAPCSLSTRTQWPRPSVPRSVRKSCCCAPAHPASCRTSKTPHL